MSDMGNVVRIVPSASTDGRLVSAQGTYVLMPDGQQMPGVHKIELVAQVGHVWRARIHCAVVVDGDIVAEVMPPEVIPAAMARIEAKLDALLSVLAEEDDEEELQYDLDGIAQPAQRNPLEPL